MSERMVLHGVLIFVSFASCCGGASFTAVELAGQFGNQLFQLATGYAYALDNGVEFFIPDLVSKKLYNIPHNRDRLYNYIGVFKQKEILSQDRQIWQQPSFRYTPIPPQLNRSYLVGYFQSEKYFLHREKDIRDVFEPPAHIRNAVLSNHTILTSGKYTVGVQIRDYRKEQPQGRYHPTLSEDYYNRAMERFPKDAVFIVTSNNEGYARMVTKKFANRAIYLTSESGEDYIEHFYALYFCKGFVIANSSFGWWAAWLSRKTDKIIIAPKLWFAAPYKNTAMTADLYSKSFTVL